MVKIFKERKTKAPWKNHSIIIEQSPSREDSGESKFITLKYHRLHRVIRGMIFVSTESVLQANNTQRINDICLFAFWVNTRSKTSRRHFWPNVLDGERSSISGWRTHIMQLTSSRNRSTLDNMIIFVFNFRGVSYWNGKK